jgi:hypothetical protein
MQRQGGKVSHPAADASALADSAHALAQQLNGLHHGSAVPAGSSRSLSVSDAADGSPKPRGVNLDSPPHASSKRSKSPGGRTGVQSAGAEEIADGRRSRSLLVSMSDEFNRSTSEGSMESNREGSVSASSATDRASRPSSKSETGKHHLKNGDQMVLRQLSNRGGSGSIKSLEEDMKRTDHASCAFRTLRAVVGNPHWEGFFAVLVFLNTLIMLGREELLGIQEGARLGIYEVYGSEDFMQSWGYQAKHVMLVVEVIFAVLFTIEIGFTFTYDLWTLKLGARCQFRAPFWRQPLEIVDACVIWISNLILLSDMGGPLAKLKFLRILRLLRLLRLIRLVRRFHFLDSLHLMTTALAGSFGSLCFSAMLLFVILTVFAMLFTTSVRWQYFHDESTLSDETKTQLFLYFGTYSRSMLSMFELALANWPQICRFLMEEVHESFGIFCMFYKWSVGVAAIAVINGVFMQEIFSVAANDEFIMVRARMRQSRQHSEAITRLFKMADQDGSGTLSKEELAYVLGKPAIRTWLEAMELRCADANMIFELISDGRDEVSIEAFIQGIGRLKGPARNIDVVSVLDILKKHQDENTRRQEKVMKRQMTIFAEAASAMRPQRSSSSSRSNSPEGSQIHV